MHCHDQRPGACRIVLFGHVQRESATGAGRTADMHGADIGLQRIERGELFEPRLVVANRRFEEELADRPQMRRHRVERLAGTGVAAQCPGMSAVGQQHWHWAVTLGLQTERTAELQCGGQRSCESQRLAA